MRLFPRRYFHWREPVGFRRALHAMKDARSRWWHKPVAISLWFCCFMALWGMAHLNPGIRPLAFLDAVLLALIGSHFLVLLKTLSHLFPSTVTVFEKALLRSNGATERWPLKNVEAYGLRDCSGFRVLILHLRGGRQSLIGVPPEVDPSRLEEFLGSVVPRPPFSDCGAVPTAESRGRKTGVIATDALPRPLSATGSKSRSGYSALIHADF